MTWQVRGFTDEAITFATALEEVLDLRLEIAEPWQCEESVLRSLPVATREAVRRSSARPLPTRSSASRLPTD